MKPTVVVGYDHTPPSERALLEAGREAAWRDASVLVVHAFHWVPAATPMTYTPLRVEESLRDAATEIAETGADVLRHRYPGMDVKAKAIAGAPFDVLTAAARDADLLVVGNRGRGGFAELLLGSVSLRALTHSACPTMVVRAAAHEPHDVVLAAVDIEDPADEVLRFAFTEAARRSARLRALAVVDLSWTRAYLGDTEDSRQTAAQALGDAESVLEKVLVPWRAEFPEIRVDAVVADGAPGAVLTEAGKHADLVVAGIRRHGDSHHGMRLGPVAHALLHHSESPVAVVPRG